MPLSFSSNHELIAAQDTGKAALATKVCVQLVATDSQIIQQTRKGGGGQEGGGEDGGKEGVQGESAGAYPVNCSLGDEGPRVVLGSIPPPSLNLFTFSTTALLNSSKMPSCMLQASQCTMQAATLL